MSTYLTDAPRKRELFKRLRCEFRAYGLRSSDVARLIGSGTDYVSRCLNGKAFWKMDEMYKILEAIGEKPESLHQVFPKGGIDKDIKVNRQGAKSTFAVKESSEELQLLPPVKVGNIGNRDVFITISYR